MVEPTQNRPGGIKHSTLTRAELWISVVLRIGVVLSLTVIVVGMLITFCRHPDYLSSKSELARLTNPGASFPQTLVDVADGVHSLKGQAIVSAGLLLLIITPVMRVAISIVAFVEQRDYLFVLITAAVLAILLFSFLLGKVEM